MKIIVLAAGQGQRLRPHTDNKPKCMVEFKGKPIIDYIIENTKNFNFEKVVVVNGYKKEVLEKYLEKETITFYTNNNFDSSNMVTSLFCAESELNDDIIISYSDIVYKKEILEAIYNSNSDISVIIDKKWKELWQLRMENPLSDAETLKLDDSNNILELGKKAKSYNDIQGQYIGLIKISKAYISKVVEFYHSLDKKALYDGKDFDNMYMTSFIQMLIDKLTPVKAVLINGGWVEVDSVQDLEAYDKLDF